MNSTMNMRNLHNLSKFEEIMVMVNLHLNKRKLKCKIKTLPQRESFLGRIPNMP